MCNDNDESKRAGFQNLGALTDFISSNSYFPRPWKVHERIDKPDQPAAEQD